MILTDLHSWPSSIPEAVALQRDLAKQVRIQPLETRSVSLVAGADVSCIRFDRRLWAAVVVLRLPDLQVVEVSYAQAEAQFPYIPGLLSFRELPVIITALRNLKATPDLMICDGQGTAHQRFFGLACHLGLWTHLPTIGCAKSRLVGEAQEPGSEAGCWSPLLYEHQTVGAVVRTRRNCQPLYVSPGNLIDLKSALHWILSLCRNAKMPEPTRLAHLLVNQYRKAGGS
ncbi:MAG: deoxyribonuclease V [bacterium]